MEANIHNKTLYYYLIREKVMERYHYNGTAEKPDYNLIATMFFNPYYSLMDFYNQLIGSLQQLNKYMNFLSSSEFNKFSLLNRTKFPIPYYNILGDKDYQTNHFQAEDYFNKVKAPHKKLYIMKNMTHGLLTVRSGEFSDIMHEIAKLEQNNNSTTTIV